jgi:hypothetical protein
MIKLILILLILLFQNPGRDDERINVRDIVKRQIEMAKRKNGLNLPDISRIKNSQLDKTKIGDEMNTGFYFMILISTGTLILMFFVLKTFFKLLKSSDGRGRIDPDVEDRFEHLRYRAHNVVSDRVKKFDSLIADEIEKVELRGDDRAEGGKRNEILNLARRYNVGQGEVELLLNLRSKGTGRTADYNRIIQDVERTQDIRKVAKKHKIGYGEIELLLNLQNADRSSFGGLGNKFGFQNKIKLGRR